MTDTDELEALKRRREKLLLEREVASLEKKQQVTNKAGKWSWWWVGPLSAAGAYCVLGGLAEGTPAAVVFGLVLLVPVALKVYAGLGR
jgi:hypothetical protein